MTKTPHPSMEEVRANCLQRMIEKLTIAKWLRGIQQDYQMVIPRPVNPGRVSHNDNVAALMVMVGLNAAVIEDDIWMDIEQFASLFARDVLVEEVRTSGNLEPVVMLTGNSYVPAYRSFEEIERIWEADEAQVYITEMWERIERKCLDAEVFIGYPEYDNCIYGVDMRKWEQSEASANDEPLESLNDEWSWIDPKPKED
jgi:hypothetical protein